MGENRDKRYAVRMSEEEMKIVNEVMKAYDLPELIREYIVGLHKKLVEGKKWDK